MALTVTKCIQPARQSVLPLSCCSVHVETPGASCAVRSYNIYVLDSLDGYVADGRVSVIGLLKSSRMRLYIRSTIYELRRQLFPSLVPPRWIYSLPSGKNVCRVDRSSEVIRAY